MSDSPLEALIQEQLASVVFVMDYLQLDSGDARFTAYVWPAVTIGGATLGIGDPGYRDALCAFITQEVMPTEESAEAGLVVRFGLGEVVTNPEPTDLSGPEIAQVQLHEGPFRDAAWTVWRPGEGVFARREWSCATSSCRHDKGTHRARQSAHRGVLRREGNRGSPDAKWSLKCC